MRAHYLDESQRNWLRNWWRALQPRESGDRPLPGELRSLGLGDRAKLKRACSIEELETESAANLLVAHLLQDEWAQRPSEKNWLTGHCDTLFLLVGVLAQVKKDVENGKSLAWCVGNANPRSKKTAAMSELRFKRLLRERDAEDFYRQMRRAMQLADGVMDIAVLAEDVLSWSFERSEHTHKPSESMKFRWARDYYMKAKEQSSSESDNASEV